MPTYQYACPDCGYKFELKQKFTDDPVKACPNCGRRHVYRVVGPVALSFKGSGWYITDSKSSAEKHSLEHKPKEPATAGANGTSDAAGSGAEKSEAKAETKSSEPASKTTEKSTETSKPAKKETS